MKQGLPDIPNPSDIHLDLSVVARELLREAGSITDAHETGRAVIEAYLRDHIDEAVRLALPILANQLWDAIRRQAYTPGARPAATRPDTTVAGLASVGEAYLYQFTLPNGERLGNATRDMVVRNLEVYRRTQRESARNAKWLELIAARMRSYGGGTLTRVRDCVPHADLRTLLGQAERATLNETGGDRKGIA